MPFVRLGVSIQLQYTTYLFLPCVLPVTFFLFLFMRFFRSQGDLVSEACNTEVCIRVMLYALTPSREISKETLSIINRDLLSTGDWLMSL